MATYTVLTRDYDLKVAGSVRDTFELLKDKGTRFNLEKPIQIPATEEGKEPTEVKELELNVKNLRSELKGRTELEVYAEGSDEWVAKVKVFH